MDKKMEILLTNDAPGLGRAGERVTLALSPSDVHDSTELPTYLAGYKPFGFRADEASKIVLVENDSGKYRSFNSDDAFRTVDVKTSTQGAVAEVDPKSALEDYSVVGRAIGSFIPAQTQAQGGNAYDPMMAAGRRCRWALDLDREIDVWTLLGTSTNWDSSVRTSLAAAYKWNGGASARPIYDLQTAIEKSWQPVTEIWMNQQLANTFLRDSSVASHMRQYLGDSAVGGAIRNVSNAGAQMVDFLIPGLPPIKVVASKKKNESTGELDYVLSSNACVLLSVPSGEPTNGEEIASTYTFRSRGLSGTGFDAREVDLGDRGRLGGTLIVVSNADVAKMTGNKCGGIITGCYV